MRFLYLLIIFQIFILYSSKGFASEIESEDEESPPSLQKKWSPLKIPFKEGVFEDKSLPERALTMVVNVEIFSYLNFREVAKISLTCKAFYVASQEAMQHKKKIKPYEGAIKYLHWMEFPDISLNRLQQKKPITSRSGLWVCKEGVIRFNPYQYTGNLNTQRKSFLEWKENFAVVGGIHVQRVNEEDVIEMMWLHAFQNAHQKAQTYARLRALKDDLIPYFAPSVPIPICCDIHLQF